MITTGYIVHSDLDRAVGRRTYACTDLAALADLILHLTGRAADTFPQEDGIPVITRVHIGYPFQIWNSDTSTASEVTAQSVRSFWPQPAR